MRPTLLRSYADTLVTSGEQVANLGLRWAGELFAGALPLNASDSEICERAAARARHAKSLLYSGGAETREKIDALIASQLQAERIESDGVDMAGMIARVTSARWWRRRLRAVVMRKAEGGAIRLGLVNLKAGVYASDDTVTRRRSADKRNAAAMAQAVAVNELGQEYTVAELSARSVSDPEVWRDESCIGPIVAEIAITQAVDLSDNTSSRFNWALLRRHLSLQERPRLAGTCSKSVFRIACGDFCLRR